MFSPGPDSDMCATEHGRLQMWSVLRREKWEVKTMLPVRFSRKNLTRVSFQNAG